jgi:hypothetical protein
LKIITFSESLPPQARYHDGPGLTQASATVTVPGQLAVFRRKIELETRAIMAESQCRVDAQIFVEPRPANFFFL